jgi:hypothetical protein
MQKIAWSGLTDSVYWDIIASCCVPSWDTLPGDKYLICDFESYNDFTVINSNTIDNPNSDFLKTHTKSRKQNNFWKKMRSQVWAIKNLKSYDCIVLLDTDIEVYDFNQEIFNKHVDNFLKSNCVWGLGNSQLNNIDSGMIFINPAHPLLNELVYEYENTWESGEILKLPRAYDGYVVLELVKKYPFYEIPNWDYNQGQHNYNFGFYHWGGKESKPIRKNLTDSKHFIHEKIANNSSR